MASPFTMVEVTGREVKVIAAVPSRFAGVGDLEAAIDDTSSSLEPLLDLAARDEAEGLGDAPWPPNFPRVAGEPRRVASNRARRMSRESDD